jgi:subtilisin family serine protease
MTIGAVTQHGAYVGYSSQGQATVFYGSTGSRVLTVVDKPDFCCYTAFSGGYYEGTSIPNSGTSSSTALAAGVVALLKQARPDATHDMIKRALTMTSRITWDSETSIPVNIGAGVIQPLDALRALGLSRRETAKVI